MTITQFEEVIKAFITRSGGSLTTADNQSLLRVAVNNAKQYAQRTIDFKWLEDSVYIDCNPSGDVLSGMKLEDTGASVQIKRITKAFKLIENQTAKTPIKYVSQQALSRDLERRIDLGQLPQPNTRFGVETYEYAVHQGKRIWLYPKPTVTPYRLYFDAIVWLPDYSNDHATDFLLDYCRDFLLYRSMLELNFLIKEDERFEVSQTLYNDSWNSMLNWNNSLITPTDTELDL
jgi:hypothetical protein